MNDARIRRIQLAGVHFFSGLTCGLGGLLLGIICLRRDPEIAAHAFLSAIWGVTLFVLGIFLIAMIFPAVLIAAVISHFLHTEILAQLVALLFIVSSVIIPWGVFLLGIIEAARVWRGKRVYYPFPPQKMQKAIIQRIVPSMTLELFGVESKGDGNHFGEKQR